MIQTQQKAAKKKKSIKRLFNKCIPNWIKGIASQLHATDLTFFTFSIQGNIFGNRKVNSVRNELLLRQEESLFSNKRLNKYRADGGSTNTRLQRAHL